MSLKCSQTSNANSEHNNKEDISESKKIVFVNVFRNDFEANQVPFFVHLKANYNRVSRIMFLILYIHA